MPLSFRSFPGAPEQGQRSADIAPNGLDLVGHQFGNKADCIRLDTKIAESSLRPGGQDFLKLLLPIRVKFHSSIFQLRHSAIAHLDLVWWCHGQAAQRQVVWLAVSTSFHPVDDIAGLA
jgi:hypothetical protein